MTELPQSMEERVAELERWVNKLKREPLDLLLNEGYLQLGSSDSNGAQRFDQQGHQIVNDAGTDLPGVFFVPVMRPNPDSTTPYAVLEGYANVVAGNEDVAKLVLRAQAEADISAGVGAQTFNVADGVATAFLQAVAGTLTTTVSLGAAHNAALGSFALENASLLFDSLTADPSSPAEGETWYNSTDNVLRYYDGTNTIDLTASGGGMTVKVKEADETVTTNTTLQNDDEVFFAVAANEVFQFEGVLLVTAPAAADFKMTFTGPTGAVGSFGAMYSPDGSPASPDVDGGALGTSISLITVGAGRIIRFWGGIHNGANAGNLQLQWAQDTSSGSTLVLAGSHIKYQLANTY